MLKSAITLAFFATMFCYFVQGVDCASVQPNRVSNAFNISDTKDTWMQPSPTESTDNQGYVHRVVGVRQRETLPHEFPFMVGVFINNAGFCSGTLVSGSGLSNDFVLTAAHCLVGIVEARVILGAHNISDPTEEGRLEMTIINSEDFIVDPDYNPTTNTNDLGLIRIPKVEYTEKIEPVDLAKLSDVGEDFPGIDVSTLGWGRYGTNPLSISAGISDVLRVVHSRILPNFLCLLFFLGEIEPGHICMSQLVLNSALAGSCHGDSGGPLMVSGHQNGITSFGFGIECAIGPTVYTRVAEKLPLLASKGVLVPIN